MRKIEVNFVLQGTFEVSDEITDDEIQSFCEIIGADMNPNGWDSIIWTEVS